MPIALPKRLFTSRPDHAAIKAAPLLVETSTLEPALVYARLATAATGLTSAEASARLAEHGPNTLARDEQPSLALLLWRAVRNPLVVLLAVLAIVSFATGDPRAGTVMVLMILLSVGLKLVQEAKAGSSAAKLRAMISVHATALRDGAACEVPLSELVPGDVVQLAAGDMIPADVRIVQAKDLFVIQGSLTGESFPVEKHAADPAAPAAILERTTVAFLGTSVESGAATAVVIATGNATYLGGMAASLTALPPPTAFDRQLASFTWLLLRFMAVMVPLVFIVNGLTKGSWSEAFFFAVAVAVGLTPEMLPMIVTVGLSKGAVAMGRKKVIVKRLGAIQNLGAMDTFCTDKTGTLTQDIVVLERYCDVRLKDSEDVLALAYTNSHFQTGLKNVLDRAVLAHEASHAHARIPEVTKVDEIPFDFQRRIMSVVVRTPDGQDRLIAKGAPEAIFARCAAFELAGERLPMDHDHIAELQREYERLSADGFRVLAIATRDTAPRTAGPGATAYGKADEVDLVLQGYIAFLDPPKDSCTAAIGALQRHGVAVKVITGDNELVARKVCKDVGLAVDRIVLGTDVEAMTEAQLAEAAEATVLFARVSPAHKQRIIKALQSRGHIVGFMGDGINDAPALHAADVGISVDTAVDIAKATADMVLLEKSLAVVDDGVIEGRKVFANISKYVRMGASSNFGNMFSVLGASIFVPFLPMLAIQILTANLLYDLGQTTIPTDDVDPEQLQRPRPWDMKALTRFIAFIGPCSSIFDYTTYLVMLYVFGCWDVSTATAAAHSASLFQTGWFVESLITQGLVIHVIRTNKIPFLQSRASPAVFAMGALVLGIGVLLPSTPVGTYLGFTPLPGLYWPILLATIACYLVLTQSVKMWLLRRKWI
ncbi:MAG: magnesium-translocating P-type ATPase [Deltaproteobacteria bacterium]|nr:magnesium-translocating P-type ATPase [Deltaproteobacteria bacterium]